jgi:hypothetical protein
MPKVFHASDRLKQPDLHMHGWPELRFYDRAVTHDGSVWWYDELLDDGSIKRHPLQPYRYEAP